MLTGSEEACRTPDKTPYNAFVPEAIPTRRHLIFRDPVSALWVAASPDPNRRESAVLNYVFLAESVHRPSLPS